MTFALASQFHIYLPLTVVVGTFNQEKALRDWIVQLHQLIVCSTSYYLIVVTLSQEIQAFVQGSSKMGRAHTDDEQLKIEKHHVN